MGKNIVFCADGTWNGQGDEDNSEQQTNVLKLFHNLAGSYSLDSLNKADEQESTLIDANQKILQIAKYIHGVGDSKNPLLKLAGGAFGTGTITRIVRGYTFISRNFFPGDQIYLVGFSRGAYTVRALADMINKVGLLNAQVLELDNKDLAYEYGIRAWCNYQEERQKLLSKFWEIAALGRSIPSEGKLVNIPIRTIGVWDTVGSLGIPLYHFGGGREDVFEFTNTKLPENVAQGFHAVSIDELRADFSPTLWDPDYRVEQVLFAGAHSDVGGGYSDSGLSDCALSWMLEKLQQCGVLYNAPLRYEPTPDHLGKAHRPWAVITEFVRSPRKFEPILKVHKSVVDRLSEVPDYDPENLNVFIRARTFNSSDVIVVH